MVEKVWEEEEGEAGGQTKAGKVPIHGCSGCCAAAADE